MGLMAHARGPTLSMRFASYNICYFRGLAWKFSAETLAILIVELLVGLVACQRTMTLTSAYFVLALFPLSIVFIATLEAYGFD